MIDINKKYRTRNGKQVEHLHRAPDGWPTKQPWRGIIQGESAASYWTDDGKYNTSGGDHREDLIEVREPREWELVIASAANRSFRPGAIDEQATKDLNERGDRSFNAAFWEIVRVREVIEP